MGDQPQDVLLLLGRMEGKLDAMIHRMEHIDAAIQTHDKRLNNLEKFQARCKGGTTLIITLISIGTAIAAVLFRLAHRN